MYPENTLLAFTQARNVGANVIELDLQLTADSNIVVCHDPDTGRVYNLDLNVHKSTLSQLSQLRTLQEPHESMPTIKLLLIWAQKPENDNIKMMFDIKRANKVEILKVLQESFLQYSPHSRVSRDEKLDYWRSKVIIGLWTLDQYQYVLENELFMSFEKFVITFAISPMLAILEVSDKQKAENRITGISLLHLLTWDAKLFQDFSKDLSQVPKDSLAYFLVKYVASKKVELYFWTVNLDYDLKWILNFPFVKGIVGDNPDRLAELNKSVGEISEPQGVEDRVQYLSKAILRLSKLRPLFYTKVGLKRILLLRAYSVLLILIKYRLHLINIGGYSSGRLLMRFGKMIGIV